MGHRKITMQVIADTVGVSKYVVSKTLNSKPGVSEATRKKILFTAKQLGYLKEGGNPNQGLNNEKVEVENGYILVFLPNQQYQNITYTYWGTVFQGVSASIQSKKAGMIVISNEMDLTKKVDLGNLIGIITLGTLDEQTLVALSDYGLPIVMIDHDDKMMRADSLFMNNRNGIERVTDHLIGLGHKRLAFVGQVNYSTSFFDRWLGYRTSIEQAGLEHFSTLMDIEYNDDMEVAIQKEIDKWKRDKLEFPTAFVCANDHIGRRMINLLDRNGYACPRDVSVTGFDLLDEEEGKKPSLTTVQVLKQMIGQRAVERLVWRLQHPEYPSEKILIAGEMLLKESVDVPRNR